MIRTWRMYGSTMTFRARVRIEEMYRWCCPAAHPTTAVLIERNSPCHAKRCRSPYIRLWARRPKAVRSISAAKTLLSCAAKLTDISKFLDKGDRFIFPQRGEINLSPFPLLQHKIRQHPECGKEE